MYNLHVKKSIILVVWSSCFSNFRSSKKMLNRQISKCYGRNVKQLLDTQKQKFSSKMIPKKLSSLALSSNKGHINKPQNMTPGLCYNTGLGSQIRGSNCNLSLLPSSGSPSDLPLPPTPHPCKTRKTIPRQHLYEEAIVRILMHACISYTLILVGASFS